MHNSLQCLQLAYSRITILYLSINFKKFEYCRNYIETTDNKICDKIEQIHQKINYCLYIKNQNKNVLIPEIKYDQKKLFKQTLQNTT